MPREGRHRAERGDQRAQETRDRLMHMAAGFAGGGGGGGFRTSQLGGDAKHPLAVNVVTGQEGFFDKLAKALGISDSEHGLSSTLGLGGLGKQFQAMVTETRAQTQVMTQFLQEQKITNQLLQMSAGGIGGGIGGTPPVPGVPPSSPGGASPGGFPGGAPYNPYGGNQTRRQSPFAGASLRQSLNAHYANHGGRPAQHYKFGAAGGHGGGPQSFGHLRTMAAKGMHQQFGMGRHPVLHQVQAVDSGGNPYTQSIREDPDGTLTDITTDDAQVQALAGRSFGAASRVSSFAGGLAEGGVGAGLRAIPEVGIPLAIAEGVNKGAEWLTNQRAANAQYQSIYNQGNVGNIFSDLGSFFSGGYGGSTSGLGNRMGEEGFVLSNRFSFGGLAEQDARKLYQGVAGLGFSGNQQSQALQLGVQNYTNMGMPVDQWLQAVQLSAQNLNGDLANLSQQMNTVSQAAVTTGQNANTLRDSLIGNYQQVGSMVTGAGQSSLAGALTMANLGTSRAFAGMTSAGMLTNPVTLNMMASNQGMTANQLLVQANNGNVGPLATGMQNVQTQLLGNLVSPSMRTALNNFVSAHGGAAAVLNSPNTLQNAGQAMMAASNIPPSMIPQFMQSIGMTPGANIEDDYAKIAQTMLGSGVGGAAQQNNSVVGLNGGQLQGANQITAHPTGYTTTGGGGEAGAAQDEKAASSGWSNSDIGQSGTSIDKGLQTWFGANTNDASTAAVSAYGQLESKFKVSDPAISKLIQSIGNDPNVGIEVTTSKGDQVVSLDNAIRLFPDQLANGSATIVGGQYDGQHVGQVGGQDQGKNPYGSTLGKAPIAGGVQGSGKTSAAQVWAQQHPDSATQTSGQNGSGASGTVTIGLTSQAAQLLTITGTTGNVNAANAGGGVPAPASGVSH